MSRFAAFVFAILLLVSCLPATAMPTATPAITATFTLTPSPVPTATETITPTPKPLEPNVLQPETLGCYKNDMCLGLEAVDGHARYMELLEALAVEYENRQYMDGMRTADQFLEFLHTSKHPNPATGEIQAYWVPLTRNGAEFKMIYIRDGFYFPIFSQKNPSIQQAGGFFLDDVAFVTASKKEIDANEGGIADWLDKIYKQNGKDVFAKFYGSDLEMSGLVIVDGQLFFVAMNNDTPRPDWSKNLKESLLGQKDPAANGRILSAFWEMYISVYHKFGNSRPGESRKGDFLSNYKLEPDSNKWYKAELCVADLFGECEAKGIYYFSGDGALFIPAE